MLNFSIRDATPADAKAIAGLLGCLGHPSEVSHVAEEIRRRAGLEGCPVLVAADHRGRLLGLLSLGVTFTFHQGPPLARILALYVSADSRGKGVGHLLVAEAICRAKRFGCARVEVTSHLRRAEAHAFYRAQGFGETHCYFVRDL